MMVRDVLNRRIEQGDFISYPTMRRGTMDTSIALVESVGDYYIIAIVPKRRQGSLGQASIKLVRPDRATKLKANSVKMSLLSELDPQRKEEIESLVDVYNQMIAKS